LSGGVHKIQVAVRKDLPLPAGEGKGEGETYLPFEILKANPGSVSVGTWWGERPREPHYELSYRSGFKKPWPNLERELSPVVAADVRRLHLILCFEPRYLGCYGCLAQT
jgi:hypothetical protein